MDKLDEILDELQDSIIGAQEPELYGVENREDRHAAAEAIREHFLKEALELLDGMPKLTLKGKIQDDMGLFGDYVEIAELRTKLTDKFKED